MKVFLKRTVAVALALLMLATCLPATVFAAYENTHVNTGDQAADIVAVAATQVGYLEGSLEGTTAGSNNYQKYGLWYDNNVDYIGVTRAAWCAAFVSWCANQAGIPSSTVYYHAYCPYGVTWFKNQGLFQYSAYRGGSYTPKAGDIIYFQSDTEASHVGIVRYSSGGYVYTIEGNTSGQNGEVNEGGGVFAKKYSLSYSNILGYGTPNYETTPGVAAEKLGTYRVTASSLNVRTGTGTDYDIVAELQTNDLVVVTELSNGWGKVTLDDGTEGWCSIVSYGEYIGVDALNSELTAAWGSEYLSYTTNENGSVTFTNTNAVESVAVDMPLLLPIGTKTTPSFNISVSRHSGGYYFGLTQSGTGYFMMRECTSGDELVNTTTATYMQTDEQLQIDVSYWWAPEEAYQIDSVRLYLDAGSSVTVNYCYFASAADLVTSDAYNTRNGGSAVSNIPDPINLMPPDTLRVVDRTKTGGYIYQNGMLTVTSEDADGYEVAFDVNVDFTPEELSRWLISVETNVRFDIEMLVTTADGDRIFSLRDDFHPSLCDAVDGDYIPAMTGSAGLDFYSCYTYQDIVPADGISTIKTVTVRAGGVGTVIVNEIQVAANDVLTGFADAITLSDSTPDAEPSDDTLKGDVNGDGIVSTSDVRLVLSYTVGSNTLTQAQLFAADFDGDGEVTTADARKMLTATLS